MIVAIHQPHFLPWLGYLDRMRQADLFILLDHVQFERQNYQNRVMVKTGQGPLWLTVPVFQDSQKDRIMDKRVNNQRGGRLHWGRKVSRSLAYAYKGAPYFDRYAPAFEEAFSARWDRLVELDRCLLELLRSSFGITTPLVESSKLGVSGQKTDLILGLCKSVGADTFLAGGGGTRRYLDQEALLRGGVGVRWQEFRHPRYPQFPCPETFIEGLSALDTLFNCGPESGLLLRGGCRADAAGTVAQQAR